jgi:cytochrome c-type biogenesis protein
VPLSLALVAGALATLNPCGFPMLPAFLSFYAGADEGALPRASTRVAQGLVVGLLVTAGFLGVFALVGLPVTYGATVVADAVPWTGLVVGGLLVAAGALVISGRHIAARVPGRRLAPRGRGAGAMLLFGVGYGVASLACTLPVFLTVLGASLAGTAPLLAFAAYGTGMAIVLMTLSLTAALLRNGIARFLRRLLPYMESVAGALLVVAGAYLVYYWARIEFGPSETLADDPLVGLVTRFTAELQNAAEGDAALVLLTAALVVGLAATAAAVRRAR